MKIDLQKLNELSDTTPVLVDLKPTGEGYMEDFHAAGGMPALLWELRDLLHLDPIDVTGVTLGERLMKPEFVDRRYIRARTNRSPRWAGSSRCLAPWHHVARS